MFYQPNATQGELLNGVSQSFLTGTIPLSTFLLDTNERKKDEERENDVATTEVFG